MVVPGTKLKVGINLRDISLAHLSRLNPPRGVSFWRKNCGDEKKRIKDFLYLYSFPLFISLGICLLLFQPVAEMDSKIAYAETCIAVNYRTET